jgi:hypothetical protein|tara:strand:- start:421 stop:546 length:126 start_codon:yes stop_codon:yes gene_type:complete
MKHIENAAVALFLGEIANHLAKLIVFTSLFLDFGVENMADT